MMADLLRAMMSRVTEMERRLAGMEWRGKVTDVDAAGSRIKIAIGEDEDGQEVKSPWVPVSQRAGALKIHSLPSVGEAVTLRSESGDIRQAAASQFHWTDDNQSPSDDGEIHKITFGDVSITLSSSGLQMVAGGVTFDFTGAGFEQTGGHQKHDGKNTGTDHIHGGVLPGGGNTDVPAN